MYKMRGVCMATGREILVVAATYAEAVDLLVDHGWVYDRLLGGLVCPEARF